MTRRRINLREDVLHLPASEPLRVDEAQGIVYGVKVLGLESRNGRRYLREAVSRGAKLYEGMVVNIDHPATSDESRPFGSRFGRLQNAKVADCGGLRADLRYNPAHPLAKTFAWWARNDPEAIGLSHNADGVVEEGEGGILTVTDIVEVYSVDLVADPATTSGLREALMDPLDLEGAPPPGGDVAAEPEMGDEGYADHIGKAVVAIMGDEAMSPEEKKKKILHLLKLDEIGGEPAPGTGLETITEEDEEPEEEETMESLRKRLKGTRGKLKVTATKLVGFELREKLERRKIKAREACKRSGLPDEAATDTFLGLLATAKDRATVKALIEDRKAILGDQTPRSIGPIPTTPLKESKKTTARTAAEVAADLRG